MSLDITLTLGGSTGNSDKFDIPLCQNNLQISTWFQAAAQITDIQIVFTGNTEPKSSSALDLDMRSAWLQVVAQVVLCNIPVLHSSSSSLHSVKTS